MRKLLSFIVFALVGVGLVAVPAAPAQAAPTWFYTAWTGATYVNVVGSTVSSSMTAQSAVSGNGDRTSSNSTAGAEVSGLLKVGAAQTTTTATNADGGITMTSYARTAGVNLLGGLITADAVETTTTTVGKADGTVLPPTTTTKLLGLKISGVDLPLEIPKNYAVSIPGVATISLNYTLQTKDADKTGTRAWALGLQLLQDRSGYPRGAQIFLNTVAQYVAQLDVAVEPSRVGGYSYSSRVQAKVGDGVEVVSDPTAFLAVPLSTSNGKTLENATASVNIPGLATIGALKSTNTSTRDDAGNADVTVTNQTAKINVLNGLITADAINVSAAGTYRFNESTNRFDYVSEMKMTTVNLVVAGQEIPIDVSPNTRINVAGLGLVELNKQVVPVAGANVVYGVRITLSTAQAGLPVGAVVELAVAHSRIYPKG